MAISVNRVVSLLSGPVRVTHRDNINTSSSKRGHHDSIEQMKNMRAQNPGTEGNSSIQVNTFWNWGFSFFFKKLYTQPGAELTLAD